MSRPQTARKSPPAQIVPVIGEVRRFGMFGVLYEVIGIEDAANVLIRVIETGEITTYPAAKVLADPRE